jgi:Na+/H+ antiporter NhaD/arsenite permease-like protein
MIGLLIGTFIIGYLAIATEHLININKAASALITGVLCWTIYIISSSDHHLVTEQLTEHLGELSGILFFLLGAMAIVELIDAHQGFDIITKRITQTDKRKLLWIVSLLTFFLSPVLDNLTTTIVMISLLRKLVKEPSERLFFAGMIILASNAGGAWSPIGDVTTTMLWIGNQVTANNIIVQLFLPSLVCLMVPLIILSFKLKGRIERPAEQVDANTSPLPEKHQYLVFTAGVIILISVPIFKTVTHLPPYMGMLIGLGILWVITEVLHGEKNEEEKHIFSVGHALERIDTPSILFFLGILLSIAALQVTGVLASLATWMNTQLANVNIIVVSMGLLSSIIDNVPLVAAAQGMYTLEQFPTDDTFWQFLAYCTGTGGSALIIGSAAGVAAMGLEKISFFWYLRNITLLALAGYFAGAGFFILQQYVFK